ncbi:hypothetical protein [Pseudoroseicyclus tamaricis]|uniref:hypothetical protein n=1 Tax=Pseudoroseicyclus tamaricis TaxID=2705421 RepID=UPI001F356D0E|nr:hypothetical protein [Pseudoroseicyclus tamaricis]
MTAQLIAWALITPFTLAFIYAGIHEYRRYKSGGKANYGLTYDEETGTTYITGIGDEEGYQIDDYDPSTYRDPDVAVAQEEPATDPDSPADDDPEADDRPGTSRP